MAAYKNSKRQRMPAVRCAGCGHREADHGKTGTRPCLASVGRLLQRDFCSCDSFQPGRSAEVAAAAPVMAKPFVRTQGKTSVEHKPAA